MFKNVILTTLVMQAHKAADGKAIGHGAASKGTTGDNKKRSMGRPEDIIPLEEGTPSFKDSYPYPGQRESGRCGC